MNHMKIAFLTRSLERGGAERQLVLLACELKKNGHDVSVMVFYGGGPLEVDLIKGKVRIINLHKKTRWDIGLFLIRTYNSLKMLQPDVLYSFLTVPNLIALLYRPLFLRLKIVWGVRASNMDMQHYDWLSKMTAYIEQKLAFLTHGVIANSYAGMEYAKKLGFPEKLISVIPNGIDTSRFCAEVSSREKLRLQWGIKENERLIGMIARIDPMKDYATFLRAAAVLSNKRKDLRFLCMGRGSEQDKSQLKVLADHLGLQNKLIWCEEHSAVEIIYHTLDVFCLTSSFGEGFSNVLGEAMACGLPCVATQVGDASLILGEYGRVVPVKNPLCFAEAIEQMLEVKCDRRLIRKRIEDNFSVERMIQKTESVLEALLLRRGENLKCVV